MNPSYSPQNRIASQSTQTTTTEGTSRRKSKQALKVWPGVVLVMFACSFWAGAGGEPGRSPDVTSLARQMAWQDAQEQPEVPGIGGGAPGAEAVLGMGNNEPTVAVDPNNPLRIAVATYLGIRVSTDGGLTFQPRVNIAAPAGYSTGSGGDSSLAYDSQGRLFWTFLLNNTALTKFDVFIAQCNPATGAVLAGYPANITASAGVPADANHNHDKEWLAADHFAASPFKDQLYVVWTDFSSTGTVVRATRSLNQGIAWSVPVVLSAPGEGFVWPSDNTVAPNGDVYAGYHSQTGFNADNKNPDGTSGKIYLCRSVNGGGTFPQKNLAYAAGQADITFNYQTGTRTIPKTQFWLQGSVQPRILADPLRPGRIYVVANDEQNVNDPADVMIVISTDNGLTWSAPRQIDSGPVGTLQVMPAAAIDPVTGCIVVTYYDTRAGLTNASGHYLLDVYTTVSPDGGVTFLTDFKINTASFNPDLNAPCRFDCGGAASLKTLRIGEYNGVAMGDGIASAVWTGNNAAGFQDTYYTQYPACFADKWLQIPDTSFNGLDVKATDPKILADDFRCNATGPITQVRIWGSWNFDNVPTNPPPCFYVGIWTDIPADTNLQFYSRPGEQLCNWYFYPGSYTYFQYTNNVYEQFFDPNTGQIIGQDFSIWEYVFDFPTNFPCIQTNGNVYWLSITADCFDTNQFLFGWKTCPTNWNDDAVFGDSSFFGGPPPFWQELRRPPFFTNSLDLAFEVLTTRTNPPPTTTDSNKWLQIPDTSFNGLDVKATDPKILADDFRCTSTGPITQIRIWGSWNFDNFPPVPPCFCLGIWTDIPANTNFNFYSRPGQQLCNYCFYPGQYTYFIYTNNVYENFFDPNLGYFIGQDFTIWEYVFDWPTNFPCIQTNGNVYWLSVTADCFDTNQYMFGWKTCPTNWNDDAVFGDSFFFNGQPNFWQELRRPPFFTNSLDLSFQIITTPPSNPPPVVDTNKWLQIPDASTNGIDVLDTDPKILADDFLCTATGPITQIRIWGSWRYDIVSFPCFGLGIWTDAPNTNNTFSRPGLQLCNYFFGPAQYTNFAYTNVYFERFYDPAIVGTNGYIGTDTIIWEYIFNLPTNQPCIQTNGNIYWLSLTADCFDTNQFLFGWKTCPTNWNDGATWIAANGFNNPIPPWRRIRRPGTTNNLDLSFEIITTPQTNQCPLPVILCSNRVIECGTPLTTPIPAVIDQCCPVPNLVTLSSVSSNGVCPQVITLVWQYADCMGRVVTCTETITVVDTTPPVMTCAPNKTVQCGAAWTFNPPTASDLCCGSNVTISILNTFTNILNTCTQAATRTWRAMDCCSNLSTICTQVVTIVDSAAPVMTCASNKTVPCGTAWSFDPPSALSLCSGSNVFVGVTATFTNVINVCTNVSTRIWSATNLCSGAVATCTQAVSVVDTTPPVILNCTNIIILVCSTNPTIVTWTNLATDACSSVTVTSAPPSGTTFLPNTTNAVVVTARDACGNTNSCTFSVIVRRPPLGPVFIRQIATNKVVLTWTNGLLQVATNVIGPYVIVPGATSPYTNTTLPMPPTNRFYRLICP